MEYFRSAGRRLRVVLMDHLGSATPREQDAGDPLHNSLELPSQQNAALSSISWPGPKAKRARLETDRVHGRSSNPTPISVLPPEILGLIFLFTLPQPCDRKEHLMMGHKGGRPLFPQRLCFSRCPDTLAHVCPLWRSIAISSPSLWTHIDLSWDKEFCERLLARAETYLARVGGLPLEIHILADKGSRCSRPMDKFLRRVMGRTGSLELYKHHQLAFRCFSSVIFEELSRGSSIILTKLVLNSSMEGSAFDGGFCAPHSFTMENSTPDLHSCLDLPVEQIETILAPLKTLSDLRLSSSVHSWFCIKQSTLVTILQSSPALQILHFEIDLLLCSSVQDNIRPVDLPDLQIVKVSRTFMLGKTTPQVGNVLRLLAPGAKPLCLWIDHMPYQDISSTKELETFFARSRVVKLYYEYGPSTLPIDTLLHHAPHLKVLVLYYAWLRNRNDYIQFLSLEGQATSIRLDSLYLTGDRVHIDFVRVMLDLCPNGIKICNVSQVTSGPESRELVEQEILERFPTISIIRHENRRFPFPTAHWDTIS